MRRARSRGVPCRVPDALSGTRCPVGYPVGYVRAHGARVAGGVGEAGRAWGRRGGVGARVVTMCPCVSLCVCGVLGVGTLVTSQPSCFMARRWHQRVRRHRIGKGEALSLCRGPCPGVPRGAGRVWWCVGAASPISGSLKMTSWATVSFITSRVCELRCLHCGKTWMTIWTTCLRSGVDKF